jgi:hypothetical protein
MSCLYLSIVDSRMICGHCSQKIWEQSKAQFEVSEKVCGNCPLIKRPEEFPCDSPRPAPSVLRFRDQPKRSSAPAVATVEADPPPPIHWEPGAKCAWKKIKLCCGKSVYACSVCGHREQIYSLDRDCPGPKIETTRTRNLKVGRITS